MRTFEDVSATQIRYRLHTPRATVVYKRGVLCAWTEGPRRRLERMEVLWARWVHGATERLLLLLGWERRAPTARVGVYKTAAASAAAAAPPTAPPATPSAEPKGFFGTAAPKLKLRPSQPPTHVAGDPYAWNADPFSAGSAGACSATV